MSSRLITLMILDLFLGREAEGVRGMMYRLVFISQSCNMKPIIQMCTLSNKQKNQQFSFKYYIDAYVDAMNRLFTRSLS